eukprot:5968783-Amphidinium_carterae.3
MICWGSVSTETSRCRSCCRCAVVVNIITSHQCIRYAAVQVKQGEVDWLMKHQGGGTDTLPELPVEYEWVKDANVLVKQSSRQATLHLFPQGASFWKVPSIWHKVWPRPLRYVTRQTRNCCKVSSSARLSFGFWPFAFLTEHVEPEDVAEKSDDAWIAIKKKMSKAE